MAEEAGVPPGFRFFPTEEELISFYLHNMLQGTRPDQILRIIPLVRFYQIEPWHLPKLSGERSRDDPEQWFFFSPRQEREAHGGRPTRTTQSGYWKATGSPNYVYSSDNRVIGVKKTMVFYKGKAPAGRKTKWKLNEYRAIQQQTTTTANQSKTTTAHKLRHELSVCRVYVTSGSLRAFDRRPLEGDDTVARPVADASPNDMIESSNGIVAVEPPVWDWEELNWT